MKRLALAVAVAVAVITLACGSLLALEKRSYCIKDDVRVETFQDCFLQYYYHIPCESPTESWFWALYDWRRDDIIGQVFTIGDMSMSGYASCDSAECHHITGLRVLDFADYSQAYPGLYTVRYDVYCADELGCPAGPPLWSSDPVEPVSEWSIVPIDPPIGLTECCIDTGPPPLSPRILVTATHIGSDCTYPQWGLDNISTAIEQGCDLHELGCLPALYPRPELGYYSTIHSGYYGLDFEHCPPIWFLDGDDTTEDGSLYGHIELAWRLYISCLGPVAVQPTTWGSLKALYR
jgi:hypothetical protein